MASGRLRGGSEIDDKGPSKIDRRVYTGLYRRFGPVPNGVLGQSLLVRMPRPKQRGQQVLEGLAFVPPAPEDGLPYRLGTAWSR
jgi:hypothetical protein